jgi:hypothetical protein
MEVHTADESVLHIEPAAPAGAKPAKPQVVRVDAEVPAGEEAAFEAFATELVRALRSGQPPQRTSVWPWLIPAVLVFVVGAAQIAMNRLDEPEVDCVAYVQALTALAVARPDGIDAAALATTFGDEVIDECGTPATFMAAIE